MYFELKENKPHGTKDDPFSTYHIKNEGRSFQIPVHWHDELEIIYVKSGFLTVSISGENYIGTPGDAFVVSGMLPVKRTIKNNKFLYRQPCYGWRYFMLLLYIAHDISLVSLHAVSFEVVGCCSNLCN